MYLRFLLRFPSRFNYNSHTTHRVTKRHFSPNNTSLNHIPTNIHLRTVPLFTSDENKLNKLDWPSLFHYASISNLLKHSHSEIIDWLKLFEPNVLTESIHIRDVESVGQKYITYETMDEFGAHSQYVIVRGTKNWKNIKSSLQYKMSYNEEFAMYLHNGYGSASHAVLQDLLPFINSNAQLKLTGHSYGGVICVCLASKLQQQQIADINRIVTFGMPQFSNTQQMNEIYERLPLVQVQHIRDEIAKFDWNRFANKRRKMKEIPENVNGEINATETESDCKRNVIYIGDLVCDESSATSSFRNRFVHRMSDYVKCIEQHLEIEGKREQ